MEPERARPTQRNLARFIGYVAVILTAVMLLFPPYTSLNGTEHAFVLTGPEWSRALGAAGAELGLSARIHWPALLVQLAALWAIALGAVRLLVPRDEPDLLDTPPSRLTPTGLPGADQAPLLGRPGDQP